MDDHGFILRSRIKKSVFIRQVRVIRVLKKFSIEGGFLILTVALVIGYCIPSIIFLFITFGRPVCRFL
jgi:hypothetical protein